MILLYIIIGYLVLDFLGVFKALIKAVFKVTRFVAIIAAIILIIPHVLNYVEPTQNDNDRDPVKDEYLRLVNAPGEEVNYVFK